jgi:hypothetical protein
MPHPGLKVATNPDFDGKLSGIHQLFKMLAFETLLLSSLIICIEDHSHFAMYLHDAA